MSGGGGFVLAGASGRALFRAGSTSVSPPQGRTGLSAHLEAWGGTVRGPGWPSLLVGSSVASSGG